jgi:hypothetical protein
MSMFFRLQRAHKPLSWARLCGVALAASVHVGTAWAQLAPGKQPVAWVAPLEFSTFKLSTDKAVAFRGDYIRQTWDGDLAAYKVSPSGLLSPKWNAHNTIPAHNNRIIFTSKASGSGTAFRWSGNSAITPGQQALLGDATMGPLVLNYLRGDTSNELKITDPQSTGQFRPRITKMGAVIHSRPFFHADTVYVGANDGMLHAFDAATGAERWAYVPSMLFNGNRLASLSTPWVTDYPYLVDGSMAIGSVGNSTMLVGALGAGGKGLFALDITNPKPSSEAAATTMAKWELTDASPGYGNLGEVMASPQIVKLNNGTIAALVPNGLNSTGKVSSLFVIRVSDGAKLAEIAAGTALADGSANALGAIAAVDRDSDGTVDVVFAGDLKGTLWKFDLSTRTLPRAAAALFIPSPGEERPITAAPSVSLHPRGGFMVNFGTGKVHNSNDLSSTATEFLYGVWDAGGSNSSNLVTQTLSAHTLPSSSSQVRTVSSNAVSFTGRIKGWRIALTGGERLIGNDLLTDGGRFIVTTTRPAPGTNPGAWLLQVNALDGSAPAAPFFDLNNDGMVNTSNNSDRIAVRTSGDSFNVMVPVGRSLGVGVWSQPVLAQLSALSDAPFFNFNPNETLPNYTTIKVEPEPPPGGVAGGHFDFDIFFNCSTGSAFSEGACTNHHTHQWDDKYGVVGVNLLNSSDEAYNLDKPIPNRRTPFKVLVANTNWSPAAGLQVGKLAGLAWTLPVSPEGFLAASPNGPALVFERRNVDKFIYFLPVNAFSIKKWDARTDRSGLIPTQTGCVRSNKNPTAAWMDGAFTIQVVSANATGAHVQRNMPADAGGFRLKDDGTSRSMLLAQYTTFWHHSNKACKTDRGWTPQPPPAQDGSGGSPPQGTDDPRGNFAFGLLGNASGFDWVPTGGYTKYMLGDVEVQVNITVDNNGIRQILTNTSGMVVSDRRSNVGSMEKGAVQEVQSPRLGRLAWKEIVR